MKNCKNKIRPILIILFVFTVSVEVATFALTCRHEESYENVVLKETCTTNGVFDVVCAKCEEILQSQIINARGHQFSDYQLEVAPSKNKNGVEARYCSKCNAKEERAYVCPHLVLHTQTTPPTCSEQGTNETFCEYCKTTIELSFIDEFGCTYGDWVVTKGSTCVEYGTRQRVCARCNAIEEEHIELVDCSYGDWIVTKKSTCTEHGSRHKVCSWCGSIKKESIKLADCDYKFHNSTYDKNTQYVTNYYKCVCGKTTSEKEKVYSEFAGTLRIPSVGLVVNTYNSMSQSVCDRKNSACYFKYAYGKRVRDVKIIGDHRNQGFNKIKKCHIGCIATIDNETYRCIEIFTGHNNKGWLSDDNYNDISTHAGDLFMYTCNDHWRNITIVAWVRI